MRPTRTRWVIFGLACAVSWMLYLHRYAWSIVRPDIKTEFKLDDVQLGILDSSFNLTYAFGQVPGGLAGDLFGPRAVLTIIIIAWSACLAALAWAGGFYPLAAVRALFGVTQAGAYPNLSKVSHSWFPVPVRTTMQGMVASMSGRAGGACAPLLVGTLLMGTFYLTWRESLLVLSLAGVVLGLAFYAFFRNRPREHPWSNPAEASLIEAGSDSAAVGARPRIVRSGAGRRNLIFLLIYAFCSTFADQLFVFWLPQFLVEAKGMKMKEMGIYASLPLIGGAIGGLVGGVMNDVLLSRMRSRRVARAVVALAGKGLGGVCIAATIFVEDGRGVMVVLMLAKFFGDWSLSTLWGTITDVAGRATGTVFGVINMMGSFAGFLASPAMGYVKQYHGWNSLFLSVAGVYIAAALCWLFIDTTKRVVTEEAPANA